MGEKILPLKMKKEQLKDYHTPWRCRTVYFHYGSYYSDIKRIERKRGWTPLFELVHGQEDNGKI